MGAERQEPGAGGARRGAASWIQNTVQGIRVQEQGGMSESSDRGEFGKKKHLDDGRCRVPAASGSPRVPALRCVLAGEPPLPCLALQPIGHQAVLEDNDVRGPALRSARRLERIPQISKCRGRQVARRKTAVDPAARAAQRQALCFPAQQALGKFSANPIPMARALPGGAGLKLMRLLCQEPRYAPVHPTSVQSAVSLKDDRAACVSR